MIKSVYSTLREAEHRSMSFVPYWKLPFADKILPDQVQTPLPPLLPPQPGRRTKGGLTADTGWGCLCVGVWLVDWHQVEFKRNMRLLNDVLNALIAQAVASADKADVEELTYNRSVRQASHPPQQPLTDQAPTTAAREGGREGAAADGGACVPARP